MATEFEFDPAEFITIGTIGPKGRREFFLQAGHEGRIISFKIEKEQARGLGEAIQEFIEDLDTRLDVQTEVQMAALDMDLREPIQSMFSVAQMGLAFDEDNDKVILIAQELATGDDAGVARVYCTREQMYALSIRAIDMVEAGRPSPQQNGRITYYWT